MSTIPKMDNILNPVVRLYRLSPSTLNRYTRSSNTCADITNYGHPRRCKAKQHPDVEESGDSKLMSSTKVCKNKRISQSRNAKLNQCNGKRPTRNRVDLKTNAKQSGNIPGANQTAKTKALQAMFRRNKTETFNFSCKMCQYKSKEKPALDIHMKRCHTSHKLWHGLSGSYPSLKSPLVKPKIQPNRKIPMKKDTKSQANNTSKQTFQSNRTKKLSGNTFTIQLKCYLCKVVCENRTALIEHVKLHKTPEENADISNTIIESPTQSQSTEKVLKSEESIVPCAKQENNISDGDSSIRQPEVSAEKGNEVERQLFECQICHKRFARVKFLRYHINYVHRTKKKQSLSSQSKTRSTKSTRPKNKKEINNNIFSCDLCPYTSTCKTNLIRHQKCVHEGEKLTDKKVVNIHRCHLCSYFSNNRPNFDRHLRLRHQQGKVLQCNACPLTTFSPVTLNNHIQKIHGGHGFVKTTKECKKCHTEFSSPYEMKCHLWNHLRNNTSCDTNASVEDTNTENVKNAANTDSLACKNRILFKCEYCEKQFARKNYLQDHIEYNHSLNPNSNFQSSEEHKAQNSQYKETITIAQTEGNSSVNNLHVGQEISKLSHLMKPRPGSHNITLNEKGEHGKNFLRCKFCLITCANTKALLSHLKRHVTPWGRT